MKRLILCTLLFQACLNTPTEQKKVEEITLDEIWRTQTNTIAAPKATPLVIEGSKIIYTGEVELKALDIDSGAELWSGVIDNEISLVSYVLLFDEELNRILSNHKEYFKAWDADTGELIFNLGKNEGIEAWGIGKNSLIEHGYGLISERTDAYALNKDGTIRFELDVPFGTSGIGYSDEKVFLTQGKTVHGGLTLGKIRAFDSQTGDSLWSYTTEHGGFINTGPIVMDKILYSGTWGNSPKRLVVALNPENGEVIWEYTTEEPKEFTKVFLVGPEYVYSGASGALIALDKQTGEKAWRFDWTSSTLVKPVYLEGYVYHSNHNQLFVLDADTGELVHSEPVPEGGGYIWHLAVSEDKLFVQTNNQLIAYEPWHLREENE